MRTLVYKKRSNNSDDQDNGDLGLELQNFLDFGIINTSSFVHQVQCYRITTQLSEKGPKTYFTWQTDFSNDASANLVADSSFKKKDTFKLMNEALSSSLSIE